MVVQDLDPSVPPSIYVGVHDVFCGISAAKTSISNTESAIHEARSDEGVKCTKGGFRLGSLLKTTAYSYPGPGPVGGYGRASILLSGYRAQRLS